MSEDKEMRELLDALKYTSSDRFKAVQRKFSTARNTISGDALSQPYAALFTESEKETLREAAEILGAFKNKIEHAKEIRAREERRREEHLKHCKALRSTALDRYLPRPETLAKYIDAVKFHLALQDNRERIIRGTYFGHGTGYIELDLNRGLDPQYPHLAVKHGAITCWQESREWLSENLWPYDKEPEHLRLETVLNAYRDEWSNVTESRYKTLLDRYKLALQAEFESDAAQERQKAAEARRAGFKSV